MGGVRVKFFPKTKVCVGILTFFRKVHVGNLGSDRPPGNLVNRCMLKNEIDDSQKWELRFSKNEIDDSQKWNWQFSKMGLTILKDETDDSQKWNWRPRLLQGQVKVNDLLVSDKTNLTWSDDLQYYISDQGRNPPISFFFFFEKNEWMAFIFILWIYLAKNVIYEKMSKSHFFHVKISFFTTVFFLYKKETGSFFLNDIFY